MVALVNSRCGAEVKKAIDKPDWKTGLNLWVRDRTKEEASSIVWSFFKNITGWPELHYHHAMESIKNVKKAIQLYIDTAQYHRLDKEFIFSEHLYDDFFYVSNYGFVLWRTGSRKEAIYYLYGHVISTSKEEIELDSNLMFGCRVLLESVLEEVRLQKKSVIVNWALRNKTLEMLFYNLGNADIKDIRDKLLNSSFYNEFMWWKTKRSKHKDEIAKNLDLSINMQLHDTVEGLLRSLLFVDRSSYNSYLQKYRRTVSMERYNLIPQFNPNHIKKRMARFAVSITNNNLAFELIDGNYFGKLSRLLSRIFWIYYSVSWVVYRHIVKLGLTNG